VAAWHATYVVLQAASAVNLAAEQMGPAVTSRTMVWSEGQNDVLIPFAFHTLNMFFFSLEKQLTIVRASLYKIWGAPQRARPLRKAVARTAQNIGADERP